MGPTKFLMRVAGLLAAITGALALAFMFYAVGTGFTYLNAHGLKESSDYLLAFAIAAFTLTFMGAVVRWADGF